MKERVGDEKLIIIISVAVRGFTLVHATADAGRLHRYLMSSCRDHPQQPSNGVFTAHEANWTDLIQSTRRIHWTCASALRLCIVLTGCSETRSVCAQSVVNTCIPMRRFTGWSWRTRVRISSVQVLRTSVSRDAHSPRVHALLATDNQSHARLTDWLSETLSTLDQSTVTICQLRPLHADCGSSQSPKLNLGKLINGV